MNQECTHFKELFEPYLMGELSEPEKRRLEEHLKECASCSAEFEKERNLVSMLQSLEKNPAPELLRTRVIARLEKQQVSKAPLFDSVKRLFTWSRLRLVTGAAAAILVMIWGMHIFLKPGALERTMPSAQRMEKQRAVPAMSLSEDLKSKIEITEQDKYETKPADTYVADEIDIIQEVPASRKPSPPEFAIAGAKPRRIEEAKKPPPSLSTKEALEKYGAKDITLLDTEEPTYGFFISSENLEQLRENTEFRKIRVIRSETTDDLSTVDTFYDQERTPSLVSGVRFKEKENVKSPALSQELNLRDSAPKADIRRGSEKSLLESRMKEGESGEAAAFSALPSSAPKPSSYMYSQTPSPAPHVLLKQEIREDNQRDDFLAKSPEKGRGRLSFESSQSDRIVLAREKITSPVLQLGDKKESRYGLTRKPSFIYVEIEVEP